MVFRYSNFPQNVFHSISQLKIFKEKNNIPAIKNLLNIIFWDIPLEYCTGEKITNPFYQQQEETKQFLFRIKMFH